jgi:hypothetical protein
MKTGFAVKTPGAETANSNLINRVIGVASRSHVMVALVSNKAQPQILRNWHSKHSAWLPESTPQLLSLCKASVEWRRNVH